MYNIVAQGIGMVGTALAILSFQQNTNKGIVRLQMISSLLFGVHFLLLGAYTGAAINAVGIARNFVFYFRDRSWANRKGWLWFFLAVYLAVGVATYQNPFSILPLFGVLTNTVAFWIKDPRLTRFVTFPGSPCWMVYNIINGSIAGILAEGFVMTSLIVAMLRFGDFKRRRPPVAAAEGMEKE